MRIDLLGASFTIHTDEEPGYLTKVVDYYRTQITNVQASSGSEDTLIIAILAGILTADELHKCRSSTADSDNLQDMAQEASQVATQLIRSIDESIDQTNDHHPSHHISEAPPEKDASE